LSDSSNTRVIRKAPTRKEGALQKRFFCNARKGFEYLLSQLDFEHEQSILLPAYIGISEREGSGVLDPVQANQLSYCFYGLDEALQINMQSLKAQLDSQQVKVLLVIHYFGFVQSQLMEIRRLCDERNIVLIEDCAHCYWYATVDNLAVGSVGDFSFFSIHKVIPSRTGGMLVNNVRHVFSPLPRKNLIEYEDLLSYASSVPADVWCRVENYCYLADKLTGGSGFSLMHPALVEGCIPMNLPILLDEQFSRHALFWALRNSGIETTALYYALIPELDEREFPVSFSVSKRILNLPIHADLDKSDLDYLAQQLMASIKS
jgi:dTDP-4-amino-4,6-dideoxygalactose transaminase